jgi:uncharacterized coiled-coil DUF342 family protein
MASKKSNGPRGDLSTEILVQIRDEMRQTRNELRDELHELRDELHELRGQVHETNERLDRLERRQTEDGIRLATELVAVATAVGQVRDLLRDQRIESTRLDDHEKRIAALEAKTG